MQLNNTYQLGKCFICQFECDKKAYCHTACALAYQEAKTRRVKALMEKYGDGLRFEKKLTGEIEED